MDLMWFFNQNNFVDSLITNTINAKKAAENKFSRPF